ncbi:uncharacterized protein LOC110347672 [Heterocephalus glaber]|uniref:Uncharacterized protein LOC110347672 n=1 Tax=Heterocephalus glaber TaxID=10181 RepID=A0AAX6SEF0_HETGA|nr:uncharacterized protein LOC110347672 [Heterocephalus glaber]
MAPGRGRTEARAEARRRPGGSLAAIPVSSAARLGRPGQGTRRSGHSALGGEDSRKLAVDPRVPARRPPATRAARGARRRRLFVRRSRCSPRLAARCPDAVSGAGSGLSVLAQPVLPERRWGAGAEPGAGPEEEAWGPGGGRCPREAGEVAAKALTGHRAAARGQSLRLCGGAIKARSSHALLSALRRALGPERGAGAGERESGEGFEASGSETKRSHGCGFPRLRTDARRAPGLGGKRGPGRVEVCETPPDPRKRGAQSRRSGARGGAGPGAIWGPVSPAGPRRTSPAPGAQAGGGAAAVPVLRVSGDAARPGRSGRRPRGWRASGPAPRPSLRTPLPLSRFPRGCFSGSGACPSQCRLFSFQHGSFSLPV